MLQNAFLLKVTRMNVAKGGAGKRNRLKAGYEIAGDASAKAPKKAKKGCLQDAHTQSADEDWMATGLTKAKARAVLKQGATEGWVLEVFPDKDNPQYNHGDRWFAEVKDGLVTGTSDKLKITSCRWYTKNSITTYEDSRPRPIEIKMVKAYGPRTAAVFSNLK